MVNQEVLQGKWNEIKGKIRSNWGQLTNDELQNFNGNVDQLVGLIQRKTGETRDRVEAYLEDLTSNGSSTISQAAETVRDYAQHAASAFQETSRHAAERVRRGFHDTEDLVRGRPLESVGAVFIAGLGVGFLVGLCMRGR